MKLCDVIEDLLPLYADGACSGASRELVEQHLPGCERCSATLRQLQNHALEQRLQTEVGGVVAHHADAERRKLLRAALLLSGILMVPVLVCLIVNLATGHALDWFFIVLSSLLLLGSLTVTPLLVPEHRLLWTLLCGTVSLLLLLMVCCLYTGGDWFAVAASSVLFGLSVCLLPFATRSIPARSGWSRQKGLICMLADTVLLWAMLLCIGLYLDVQTQPVYWWLVMGIAPFFTGVSWVLFLLLRYLPVNRLIRGGLGSALIGAVAFSAETLCNRWLGLEMPWPSCDLLHWTAETVDGNVMWVMLLTGLLLGAVLLIAGVACALRKRQP